MRKNNLFLLGMSCALVAMTGVAFYFYLSQKAQFVEVQAELLSLQKENRTLREDVSFIKSSQTELNFLNQKGWLTPQNRLIAMESIEQLKYLLNEVKTTFEPENIITLENKYTYRVTKIILEVKARLDQDIYIFTDDLLTNFPGILVPHELTLTREEESYESPTPSSFIAGELVFEWYALGTYSHE
ncbi:MAG: hypothetical protein K2P93_07390 [Alphaproteobacteria bacterium]|nr:hypothetical protein [Alphaproteobacteria bacterium]